MKWVSDLITGLCVALGAIVLTVNRYRQDQQVLFLLKEHRSLLRCHTLSKRKSRLEIPVKKKKISHTPSVS